jgi:hypothetical protein
MARSLNKKYFGNRNVGTAVAGDDGLGGNQVVSVTLGTLGAYTVRPIVTFSDPDNITLGGVRATGSVTSEVESATAIGGTMANYVAGDILTVTTSAGTATFTVNTVGGGEGDEVASVIPLSRGTFLYANGALTTGQQVTSVIHGDGSESAATGATLTLRYRAKSVLIINNGSGYTDAADAAVAFSQSVTGTSVLGSSVIVGQNENAIKMTAYLTGGSALPVDIIKQVSGRRYKVTDGTRTGIVKLKDSAVAVAGEASIVAIDTDSNQYYITKLAGHRAQVKQGTGSSHQFANGTSVPWTINDTSGTKAYESQPYFAENVNIKISNN